MFSSCVVVYGVYNDKDELEFKLLIIQRYCFSNSDNKNTNLIKIEKHYLTIISLYGIPYLVLHKLYNCIQTNGDGYLIKDGRTSNSHTHTF